MSDTSLALKIGALFFGLGTYVVLIKKAKQLKKYGITSLLYLLLASVLIAVTTLLLYPGQGENEFFILIRAQLIIIAIGVLHVFLAPRLLPWHPDQPLSMQLAFILSILLVAYFFTSLSLTYLVNSRVALVWHLSSLWFIVPVLLNLTIIRLLDVPPRLYKKWVYPIGANIEDPTDTEMENPVVISFIFKKNHHSDEDTTFRAKAPQEMTLGRLFYFFINDYNDRHPESPVSFFDENKQPHLWTFFKLKSKFFNIKTALDPDGTIFKNRIRENDVLICTRDNINENMENHETTE